MSIRWLEPLLKIGSPAVVTGAENKRAHYWVIGVSAPAVVTGINYKTLNPPLCYRDF
ncbi:MAG: hypothetical protein JWO48_3255 [Bryobacterales bacterium]|nr:hypothetical protein [Bryobacterales bacterium]